MSCGFNRIDGNFRFGLKVLVKGGGRGLGRDIVCFSSADRDVSTHVHVLVAATAETFTIE